MPYSSFLSISLSSFPLTYHLVISFALSFVLWLSVAAAFAANGFATCFVDSVESVRKVFVDNFGFDISKGIRTHNRNHYCISSNIEVEYSGFYFRCIQIRKYVSKPPRCLTHHISYLPLYHYYPG